MFLTTWCIFIMLLELCNSHDLIFEAYEPSGFRVSIKAQPGAKLFSFKANDKKTNFFGAEIGEIDKTGYFTYYNPDIKLTIGDTIYYEAELQSILQISFYNSTWQVQELLCLTRSTTEVIGRSKLCVNTVVLEDEFENKYISNEKWIIEQYIPHTPALTNDYEMVVYRNDPDVVFTKTGSLVIKPKILEYSKNVINSLMLSVKANGCIKAKETSKGNCDIGIVPYKYISPIVSGRIVTKIMFSYGEVEVKAKLPAGDWIYPEIYLEDEFSTTKILIAYSRGNKNLISDDPKDDIGGRLLLGGTAVESFISEKLHSYVSSTGQPFSKNFHIYKIKWDGEKIQTYVDGISYGETNMTEIKDMKVRLVLGLGIAGINHFPDNYKSNGYEKPWRDESINQVKDFFRGKDSWYPTWEDGGQMQIDYVKIVTV